MARRLLAVFDIQGCMIIQDKEERVFLSTPHTLFQMDHKLKFLYQREQCDPKY
jgi:hypothetical protein